MNMIEIAVTLLSVVIVGLVIYIVLEKRRAQDVRNTPDQAVLMREVVASTVATMQNQLQAQLTEQLERNRGAVDNMRERLEGTLTKRMDVAQNAIANSHQAQVKTLTELQEKLTNLDNTNKQVVDVTDKLRTLQNILLNPKQRGVVGEFYLNATIDNVLPPTAWQSQFKLDEGRVVDAAIFIDKKILPVDAKFSLENYNRFIESDQSADKLAREKALRDLRNDLKMRIDETSKYIDEKLNTMPFAFMFIPSEALYYDMVINSNNVGLGESSRDLVEYAYQEKHVIIVSPTTFVAYLQTVLQGLRALEIEKNAEGIRKNVAALEKHLVKYNEMFGKMGNSLKTTVNHYNEASKNFELLSKDAARITESGNLIERDRADAPQIEQK